jgi:hypothetical protein
MRLLITTLLQYLSTSFAYQKSLRFSGRESEILAAMHIVHGEEPLPFFEDHNQLVQYPNPRSLNPFQP